MKKRTKFLKRDVLAFYENMRYNIEIIIGAYGMVADPEKKREMKEWIVPQIVMLEELRKQFQLKDHGDFDEFLTEHGIKAWV